LLKNDEAQIDEIQGKLKRALLLVVKLTLMVMQIPIVASMFVK